jgi:serine/threonine protein kinase
LRRELGRGGFGLVFLAYDTLLRREIAVKVPRAETLVTPELRERFQREGRANHIRAEEQIGCAAVDPAHRAPITVGRIFVESHDCRGISRNGSGAARTTTR